MKVSKTGWGAGTKNLPIPNVLKVQYGELEGCADKNFIVMETNIDDCTGEIMGYVLDELMKSGALDAYYTPVFMKKNRPAYLLTVTCEEADMQKLQQIIFRETTTIGIRYREEKRVKLSREIVDIETEYGTVKAKKVTCGKEVYIYPEFESVKALAEKNELPLKVIYNKINMTV